MLVLIFVGLSFVIGCSLSQTNHAICIGKDSKGSYADEEDPNCQSYFFCIMGRFRQDMNCKDLETKNGLTLYYDPVTTVCSSSYKCPSLMDPITIAKMCDGTPLYTKRADKSDRSCKTYYYCKKGNNGMVTIKKELCDEGSRFDPSELKCSRRYNDMCPTLKEQNSADCINKDKGPHPDETDPTCNSFYFCMSGNHKIMMYCDAHADENSMPMYFNPETKMCMSHYKCPSPTKNPPQNNVPYTNVFTNTNYPQQATSGSAAVISNQQPGHGVVISNQQPGHGVVIHNQQPGHTGVVISNQQPSHAIVSNNHQPVHGVVLNHQQPGHGVVLNHQQPGYGLVINNQQPGHGVSISHQQPGHGILFNNQQSGQGVPINNQQPGNSVVISNQLASNPPVGGYGINIGASPYIPYQPNPNMGSMEILNAPGTNIGTTHYNPYLQNPNLHGR